LTRRDLNQAFRSQLRAASNQLKQFATQQVGLLFANGKPTADQIANFRDQINGAADAIAFRVSSQLALLPGATDRLVAQVQNNLLGDNMRSLGGQINRAVVRLNQAPNRLLSTINRAIDRIGNQNISQTSNFLATAPLNRLSIDATTGQRIALPQFMAQQVIGQFGNTLGSLASSFPNVANTAIFNNGAFNSDPAVQQQFATQLQSAIGLATNQLGSNLAVFPNNLSLFPGSGTDITTPLTRIFFNSLSGTGTGTGTSTGTGSGAGTGTGIQTGTGTGTTFTNLFSALAGAPITSATDFFPAVNSAFNNTFQNVSSTLGGFFGFPSTTTVASLPSAPFSNVFSPTFANFGNGFNNGFGSGFLGFGTNAATTGTTGLNNFLGNSFGNGFGAITTNQNTFLGFNPSGTGFTGFGGSSLSGTGAGTGLPAGTGIGLSTGGGGTLGGGTLGGGGGI